MTDQPVSEDRKDAPPEVEPNEIVALARAAKDRSDAAARSIAERAKTWPLGAIGMGVGIGSAAVAGALIFASRSRGRK